MTTTRNATIDTDTRSFPLTFRSPLDVYEIAGYVRRTMLEPEGRYDIAPLVTLGADMIAHVSIISVGDNLADIMRNLPRA